MMAIPERESCSRLLSSMQFRVTIKGGPGVGLVVVCWAGGLGPLLPLLVVVIDIFDFFFILL